MEPRFKITSVFAYMCVDVYKEVTKLDGRIIRREEEVWRTRGKSVMEPHESKSGGQRENQSVT